MKRVSRIFGIMLLMLAIALMLLLSGCSSTKDTVEDPLSNFGVEEVIPFATVAPEVKQETPTPAPTSSWEEVTPVEQTWQQDRTVQEEEALPEEATPRPAPVATVAPYSSLSYGNSGAAVTSLQKRLKELGYYSGSADGEYGSSTVTAVKRFQSVIGMAQSGIASVNLQIELYSDDAPSYTLNRSTTSTQAPQEAKVTTSVSGYTLLSKGDSGSKVSNLQKRLKALGYYSGSVDGEYGSATVNAVKKFQRALGLSETGTATTALQKKLFASSAPVYSSSATATPEPEDSPEYIELKRGSNGSRVKKLQRRLKALGYYSGTIDGNYGSSTVKAVKLFEAAYGKDQTGVATVALQKKLFSDKARIYEEPDPTPEPSEEYTTLSPGDSGSRVKKLQKRLKDLGYFTGEVKGNYLTLTTEAVKHFQEAIGVKQTGIATAALQKKLFSSSAPVNGDDDEDGFRELRKGDSGSRVLQLQERLSELGYLTGSYAGNYGDRTVAAVKRFEKRYDKEETGVATVALQKKLFSSDALPYKPSVTPVPADESEYIKLSFGSNGKRVKKLQQRLHELGYYNGSINGKYGEKTVAAVKRFQKKIGANQTGTATVLLQEKLFDPNAPVNSSAKPTATPAPSGEPANLRVLKKGNKGSQVTKLQNRLLELGYFTSKNDYKERSYDNATMKAVIAAQIARGEESDGVADLDFLHYIYSDKAWDYAPANSEGG